MLKDTSVEFERVNVNRIYFIGRRCNMNLEFIKSDDSVESFSLQGILQTSKSYLYDRDMKVDNYIVSELLETQDFSDIVKDGYIVENDKSSFNQKYKLDGDIYVEDDDRYFILCIGRADTYITDENTNTDINEDIYLKFDRDVNYFKYKLTQQQKELIQNRIINYIQ